MRILIVEDDTLMASAMRRSLSDAGFAVDHLPDAEFAEAALREEHFDLVLVDLGLPGKDGFSLVRRLRRDGGRVPILIVTARDELDDRIRALDLGADDYLIKPFALRELVARSRALIRRATSAASSELIIGNLFLDLSRRVASIRGEEIALPRREWTILEYLALHAGRVVGKERLMQAIAGWNEDLSNNAVEVHISRLRSKLDGVVLISTLRGVGYRLEEPSA
jgi:DNA-binding response OmpR family regulator